MPDFKNSKPNPPQIVHEEVNIGKFTKRSKDKRNAMKNVTNTSYPSDIDWYHGGEGIMQAVDRATHKRFSHQDGFSFFVIEG